MRHLNYIHLTTFSNGEFTRIMNIGQSLTQYRHLYYTICISLANIFYILFGTHLNSRHIIKYELNI